MVKPKKKEGWSACKSTHSNRIKNTASICTLIKFIKRILILQLPRQHSNYLQKKGRLQTRMKESSAQSVWTGSQSMWEIKGHYGCHDWYFIHKRDLDQAASIWRCSKTPPSTWCKKHGMNSSVCAVKEVSVSNTHILEYWTIVNINKPLENQIN